MLGLPPAHPGARRNRLVTLALWLLFYATFTLASPPLLDDADSVHAEVAREILLRHDWVTLYANGIRYLEKAPLLYWSMALSFKAFGVSTPAARLPLALTVLALALALESFGRRSFDSAQAGLYASLITLSSFGIFIFTRITIPDAAVCLWITLALYAYWRNTQLARSSRLLCYLFAACCALNVLTKGLIGIVFPIAIVLLHLTLLDGPRNLLRNLRALYPVTSAAVFFDIAAPWHALAARANPTVGHPAPITFLRAPASGPLASLLHGHWRVPLPTDGNVHGWAWFYFVNEHLLRYLNLRVPRDYDTVPLLLFYALLFVWLMPWSAFLPHALATIPVRKLWRQFARPRLPAFPSRRSFRSPAQPSALPPAPQSYVILSEGAATPRSSVIESRGAATPQSTVILSEGAATPQSSVILSKAAATPRSSVIESRGAATPQSTVIESEGAATPQSTVILSEGAAEPKDPATLHPAHTASPLSATPSPLTPLDQTRLLLGLWAATVMLFFSFSTRQEYYVLPALPALILLLAGWLHEEADEAATFSLGQHRLRSGRRIALTLFVLGSVIALIAAFLALTSRPPRPGVDLAVLLQQNPGDYALSFGHLLDLNRRALGAFRTPLLLTAVALGGSTLLGWRLRRDFRPHAANLVLAAGAFLFLVAAHGGLRIFAPVLTSQQLALAIEPQRKPPGSRFPDLLVINGEYEAASTLSFYLHLPSAYLPSTSGLCHPERSGEAGGPSMTASSSWVGPNLCPVNPIHILHGRSSNLWYGSFFPDAPPIFENDLSLQLLWTEDRRIFLWTDPDHVPHLPGHVYLIAEAGGKEILSNEPNPF